MKNKFLKLYSDKKRRFYITAALSLLFNFAFLIYNFIVGIYFGLVWNFNVSFYYLALLLSKVKIIISGSKEQQTEKKSKFRNVMSNAWLLFLIDFILIVPTVLILYNQRTVNIGTIPAITVAVYTTVKVTFSVLNYKKAVKHKNPHYELLKLIGIKEAVVTVITLQNTLIVTFGDMASMRILSSVTSGIFIVFLLFISMFYIIKTLRNKN